MQRAAILHDPEASGRDLVLDPVVEGDDAVRDVLLDPELRQVPDLAALAADHDRQVAFLEPAEQPGELAADDRLVGQGAEQDFDGVEEDPLGPDGLDRHRQPDEQAFEVEGAGLDDLGRVQAEGVDCEQAVLLELVRGRTRATPRWWRRSCWPSSNASSTPGSPKSRAPRTRNSIPNRVLPDPAAPVTSVGRPCGSPPLVISSNPAMPVGAFSRPAVSPAGSAVPSTLVMSLPLSLQRSLSRCRRFGEGFADSARQRDREPRGQTRQSVSNRQQERPPMRLLRLPSPCERRSGSSRASSGRTR